MSDKPSQVTVVGEAKFLTRHLEYIARQPWVDEFFDELAQLLTVLKRVNGDPDDKPVGRCYLPQHDGLCGGPIWMDTVAAIAACGKCGETWDGPRIYHLNHTLELMRRPQTEDGRPMSTPAELAAKHGVKETTIPVWAHRAGLSSVEGYYHPDLASPSAMSGS